MPIFARYSLDGPDLPLVQTTLPLAEAARRALMSQYRKLKEFERYGRTGSPNAERFASRMFSGKDGSGRPLRDDHQHAFYLPTDEDGDGRLDHLTFLRTAVSRATRFELWAHSVDPVRRPGPLAPVDWAGTGCPVPEHRNSGYVDDLDFGQPVPGDAAHEATWPETRSPRVFRGVRRGGPTLSNRSCARS